jgi:hypothetical protein
VRALLRKFVQLPAPDRRLLILAFIALVKARIEVSFLPLRQLLRPVAPNIKYVSPNTDAGKVGWAVETMSRFVPLTGNCLVRAIAGRAILARCGVRAQIRLGITKETPASLSRHAWLECGDRIITGEGEPLKYASMPVKECFAENGQPMSQS